MTGPGLLILDADRARLWIAGAERAVEYALDPQHPAVSLSTFPRDGMPSRVVLVIGVSLLECAPVSLPPVPPALRRRMLRADAARFFALDGPVAAGCDGGLAWAIPADRLGALRDAVAGWAPIEAVLPLPLLLARTGVDGTLHLPATATTHGVLQLRSGTVQQLRHVAGPVPGAPSSVDWPMVRAAAGRRRWGADDQLLDAAGEAGLMRRERTRWSVGWAAVLLALALCLTASGTRQARRQRAVAAAVQSREAPTREARAAVYRLERARAELRALDAPTTTPSPLLVLARLGRLLPRDVTIESLEWDGEGWQLQGTAREAAPLLPILAGDSLFTSVQSLAPSTRFLEQGQQRSAFRIGFRVTSTATDATTGGAHAR